jgi:integrase
MSKSSDSSVKPRTKPEKPYPDFPLFAHATRRWAKKIKGKMQYFGPWEEPDKALARYLDERDALHAGRTPRPDADALTLADVANHFLTAKRQKMDSGSVKPKTFGDYHAAADNLLAFFGKDRLVDDLIATDFTALRSELAKGRGVQALSNQIRRIRSLFKWCYEAGLLDKPMRFGPDFKQPSQRELRVSRVKSGKRAYTADEVRALVESAGVPMKAMILLGINGAFGNTDVSELPLSAVDVQAGFIEFPRPKTGIKRRVPLWPETVEALKAAMKARPKAKDKADAGLAFLTRHGRRWVRASETVTINSVSLEFGKVMKAAKVTGTGTGFYGLRGTFRTMADEVADRPAIDRIMGHENVLDISTAYRHHIADDRLRAVVDHVHNWLYPPAVKPKRKTRAKRTIKG